MTVALLLSGVEGSVPAKHSVASAIKNCSRVRNHSGIGAYIEMHAEASGYFCSSQKRMSRPSGKDWMGLVGL